MTSFHDLDEPRQQELRRDVARDATRKTIEESDPHGVRPDRTLFNCGALVLTATMFFAIQANGAPSETQTITDIINEAALHYPELEYQSVAKQISKGAGFHADVATHFSDVAIPPHVDLSSSSPGLFADWSQDLSKGWSPSGKDLPSLTMESKAAEGASPSPFERAAKAVKSGISSTWEAVSGSWKTALAAAGYFAVTYGPALLNWVRIGFEVKGVASSISSAVSWFRNRSDRQRLSRTEDGLDGVKEAMATKEDMKGITEELAMLRKQRELDQDRIKDLEGQINEHLAARLPAIQADDRQITLPESVTRNICAATSLSSKPTSEELKSILGKMHERQGLESPSEAPDAETAALASEYGRHVSEMDDREILDKLAQSNKFSATAISDFRGHIKNKYGALDDGAGMTPASRLLSGTFTSEGGDQHKSILDWGDVEDGPAISLRGTSSLHAAFSAEPRARKTQNTNRVRADRLLVHQYRDDDPEPD